MITKELKIVKQDLSDLAIFIKSENWDLIDCLSLKIKSKSINIWKGSEIKDWVVFYNDEAMNITIEVAKSDSKAGLIEELEDSFVVGW